jgi:hypothetical protein
MLCKTIVVSLFRTPRSAKHGLRVVETIIFTMFLALRGSELLQNKWFSHRRKSSWCHSTYVSQRCRGNHYKSNAFGLFGHLVSQKHWKTNSFFNIATSVHEHIRFSLKNVEFSPTRRWLASGFPVVMSFSCFYLTALSQVTPFWRPTGSRVESRDCQGPCWRDIEHSYR